MTIISVVDIASRPFSGYDDPRYPIGYWVAGGDVTGDASGGDASVQVDFNKSDSIFNSQYYSLEQVMVNVGAQADFEIAMFIFNFDRFGAATNRYTLFARGNEAAVSGLAAEDFNGFRKMFLGQQAGPNVAPGLTFAIDNTLNEVMSVMVEGYIWGVRSVNVNGGPQRPPTGLYGA